MNHQVPNLAGLARTCEIFAVSNLLVSDVRAVKSPSFSSISMGAEQWLPIGELREKQLLPWLRRYKKQGYTLVGVEQTNNSICLTKVSEMFCSSDEVVNINIELQNTARND